MSPVEGSQPSESMRVLLVHAAPLTTQGGAEISLRQHVETAPPGVRVDVVLPDAEVALCDYDAVILANLRPSAPASNGNGSRFKASVWNWLSSSRLNAIAYRSEIAWARRWRRLLMNYEGFVIRSERDVHPCAHRDGHCIATNPPRRLPCDCPSTVTRAFQSLYEICDCVQFLSPLHRDCINVLLRLDMPQHVIAPPLDLTRFRSITPREQRRQAALITGDGIRVATTAFQRARDAGYEAETIHYHSVPHDQMPDVLNSYQAVVLDPIMLHAFGRLAAEALACGCEVIASDRVGAMSWPDPVAACAESNQLFWRMVQSVPTRKNPRRFTRHAPRTAA